jgi:hypothetical protein
MRGPGGHGMGVDLEEAARRVRAAISPEELLSDAARQLRRTANLYAKNLATLREMDEAVEGWLLVRERRD